MAACLGGTRNGLHPPDFATALLMPCLKTFIVEDSPLIRENLIATLEDLVAVEVVGTAEDEASAVLWLSQPEHEIDLVITDIFLKVGSGFGVLRAAGHLDERTAGNSDRPQALSAGTTLHFPKYVVLSNYATADIRRKCMELGADRVFDKSNDIEALMSYCSRLAAGGSGDTAPGTLD
jgi:DNA-binding NarL/FixJ family response regulator